MKVGHRDVDEAMTTLELGVRMPRVARSFLTLFLDGEASYVIARLTSDEFQRWRCPALFHQLPCQSLSDSTNKAVNAGFGL